MKDIFTDSQRIELVKLLKEQQVYLTRALDYLSEENDLFAAVTLASYKVVDSEIGKIMRDAVEKLIPEKEKIEENL